MALDFGETHVNKDSHKVRLCQGVSSPTGQVMLLLSNREGGVELSWLCCTFTRQNVRGELQSSAVASENPNFACDVEIFKELCLHSFFKHLDSHLRQQPVM